MPNNRIIPECLFEREWLMDMRIIPLRNLILGKSISFNQAYVSVEIELREIERVAVKEGESS